MTIVVYLPPKDRYIMDHLTLEISIPFEYQEFLIAELLDMDFEGFEQEDDLLKAVIPKNRYNDVIREEIENWLRAQPFEAGIIEERIDEQQDWNRKWEQTIGSLVIGDFFVKPTWVNETTPEGKILLEIDPKMAFGTGYHESTRLMLRLLSGFIRKDDDILDAGTGTGILSIAALKLGAASAFGFDIDEWSRNNSWENAVINHVAESFHIERGSFEVVPEGKQYDVVTANINRTTLLSMQEMLTRHLKPGGNLLLSGLLVHERDLILKASEFSRLKLVRELQEGEWIALALHKNEER